MGLDMYAFAVEKADAIDPLTLKPDCNREKLHYWRKHHDLHGWMQDLFIQKGGEGDFNCQVIELDDDELDSLEVALLDGNLPCTTGFFFGNNPPDAESIKDDLEFIAKARQAIKDGKAVYYDSWW
jgi:hypothetical protein